MSSHGRRQWYGRSLGSGAQATKPGATGPRGHSPSPVANHLQGPLVLPVVTTHTSQAQNRRCEDARRALDALSLRFSILGAVLTSLMETYPGGPIHLATQYEAKLFRKPSLPLLPAMHSDRFLFYIFFFFFLPCWLQPTKLI